jgi:hypothetical protein
MPAENNNQSNIGSLIIFLVKSVNRMTSSHLHPKLSVLIALIYTSNIPARLQQTILFKYENIIK